MSKFQRIVTTLLGLNALLLAGVLWVLVAGRPILAETAYAQQRDLPNAGAQRNQTNALLKQIRLSVAETNQILREGPIKIVVASSPSKRQSSAPRTRAPGR